MAKNMKSLCIMVRNEQYDELHRMKVNMSGLIRDLIDDRLSDNVITLGVSKETKDLYERIISLSPRGDGDIEPHLRKALKKLLDDSIKEMQALQRKLER